MIFFVNLVEKLIAALFSFVCANLFSQETFGLLNYSLAVALIVAVVVSFGTQGVYFREAPALGQVKSDSLKTNIISWYVLSVIAVFFILSACSFYWSYASLFPIGISYAIIISAYTANLVVTDAIYSGLTKKVYVAFSAKLLASLFSVGALILIGDQATLTYRLSLELIGALICCSVIFDYRVPHFRFKLTSISKLDFKNFQYFGFTMLSQASLVIFMSSDRLLLAFYSGLNAVADYSILMYGMLPIFAVSAVVSNLSKAVFLNYENSGKLDYATVNKYLLYALPVSVASFILYDTFGQIILKLILPNRYDPVINLIPATCSLLLLNFVFLVSTRVHQAQRSYKVVFGLNLFGVAVNCTVMTLFAAEFGYLMGAISTFIAYVSMTLASLAMCVYRHTINWGNILITTVLILTGGFMMKGIFF